MSSSDQVKEENEKEWRIRMEQEFQIMKNEISLIKKFMVDKEFLKREKNPSDNCYGDNEDFSFLSPKKLKSSNDANIKRITHQNRGRSCTTSLKMKICLFEDFKLKNTFRAKEREVRVHILC